MLENRTMNVSLYHIMDNSLQSSFSICTFDYFNGIVLVGND